VLVILPAGDRRRFKLWGRDWVWIGLTPTRDGRGEEVRFKFGGD